MRRRGKRQYFFTKLISNAKASDVSFGSVTEISLNKGFSILNLKKKITKKNFCQPTDPNCFYNVTLNRGTFFWPNLKGISMSICEKSFRKNKSCTH